VRVVTTAKNAVRKLGRQWHMHMSARHFGLVLTSVVVIIVVCTSFFRVANKI